VTPEEVRLLAVIVWTFVAVLLVLVWAIPRVL